MKIENGWVTGALRIDSPNYNCRPKNTPISLLVIHNISLPPNQFDNDYVELFFQNKLPVSEHDYFETIADLEVSSHFYIRRNGDLIQFVSCSDRAWHAGQSCFNDRENCNDYSIGVELQGADDIDYTNAQYKKLAELTDLLVSAYPQISHDSIVGHSDIAPGRKTDPGDAFDWKRYKAEINTN